MFEIIASRSTEDAYGWLSMGIFIFGLGFLILLAIYTAIIRWVFRVNEMVNWQKQAAIELGWIRQWVGEMRTAAPKPPNAGTPT
jgi:hypothetical protein